MKPTLFRQKGEWRIQGIPICPGIAIGSVVHFLQDDENIEQLKIESSEIELEIDRFNDAIKKAQKEILYLRSQLHKEGGDEAAAILSTHLEITKDPLMTVCIEEQIRLKQYNAEHVFNQVLKEYENEFKQIPDQFFQERLKDFQDVFRRILYHLKNQKPPTLADVASTSIVFAQELSPSDAAEANPQFIEGFVTKVGSSTSHVAIMARSRNIPFVSNVDFTDLCLTNSEQVIVDGEKGAVIFNPSEKTLEKYKNRQEQISLAGQEIGRFKTLSSKTRDGVEIELLANFEMMHELAQIQEYGVKAIGLLRTESLFMGKERFPSEEEQLVIYEGIIQAMGKIPVSIRTFDVGGDKFHFHHPTKYEKNPYLGCRAIRLSLKEPRYFKSQIRAILRAGALGQVSILLPMISKVEEILYAKQLIEEVKQSLRLEKISFYQDPLLGCMIETPSAAITCDQILKHCDFVSIGTNDLTQYTLAVDRTNPEMQQLYTAGHTSVFRLIKQIVQEGEKAGKPVSVCGEIASDPKYTEALIGLGVKALSIPCVTIPTIKNTLRQLNYQEAQQFAQKLLELPTSKMIHEQLQASFEKINPDLKAEIAESGES